MPNESVGRAADLGKTTRGVGNGRQRWQAALRTSRQCASYIISSLEELVTGRMGRMDAKSEQLNGRCWHRASPNT